MRRAVANISTAGLKHEASGKGEVASPVASGPTLPARTGKNVKKKRKK
jgi:hypothetical protein